MVVNLSALSVVVSVVSTKTAMVGRGHSLFQLATNSTIIPIAKSTQNKRSPQQQSAPLLLLLVLVLCDGAANLVSQHALHHSEIRVAQTLNNRQAHSQVLTVSTTRLQPTQVTELLLQVNCGSKEQQCLHWHDTHAASCRVCEIEARDELGREARTLRRFLFLSP